MQYVVFRELSFSDSLITTEVKKENQCTTFIFPGEYASAPYDALIRAAGVEGNSPCSEPVRLPGDVYRPGIRRNISNRVGGGRAVLGIPKSDESKHFGKNV